MIRAANVDLFIEAGVDFSQTFELWQPTGAPIRSQDVTPGSRVYLDEVPQLVHSVTPQSDGVVLRFGQGLWWQPSIWLPAGETVMPAQAVPVEKAQAGWLSLDGRPVAIPAHIEDNGSQVTLACTSEATIAMEPFAGVWPWDLFVSTLDYGWTRLVEGSLSIIASVAEPRVEVNPLVHIG